MEEKVATVLNDMSEYLLLAQMRKLQEVMLRIFSSNSACRKEISMEMRTVLD